MANAVSKTRTARKRPATIRTVRIKPTTEPIWNVNPKGRGTNKAALFDIDGVFTFLVNHYGEVGVAAREMSEVHFVLGLEKLLNELQALGYHIIGITNQPDMSRRKFSHEGFLAEKHAALIKLYPLIEKIYVCLHSETDLCSCRKPKSGLLRMAADDFNLELSNCWVIGDSRSDIEAGMLVHARTILVQTDYNVGNQALDKATSPATSTRGAIQLIIDLEKKRTNISDA